jgi:cytochrome c-type biogenesis protein CcmH
MIWLIFAVLTACVILGITRSLRHASSTENAGASEVEAYKLQLQELDREEERGTLGRDEARQTRAEVSRRLLRASRQSAGSAPKKSKVLNAAIPFLAVSAVVSLGSIGTYVYYGKPGIPDQPLEARLDAPLAEQTLDVQVANMERRLRQNPADMAGWAALASIYFKSGLFEKAADTYQRAIDAGGENESMLLGLAESLTFANDGFITEQAAQALQGALKRNPESTRARFWSGLLAEQDGKKADAEKIYRDLLAGQIHPTLRNIVNQRLEALSAVADNGSASEGRKAAGEDAVADRGEEQKMIRGMVERLAARLEKDKSDLQGWLMLIRSYAVLKETDKAKAAMATAREQFASDSSALEQIDAINKELSFAFAGGNAPASREDNSAAQQPAAPALEGDQGKMIRGMVERLASRLKENKSDLEGWLRLIRSYAVLQETDKAQDAAATARQEFASDAKALEQIDALAKGLGLTMPSANGGQPKS